MAIKRRRRKSTSSTRRRKRGTPRPKRKSTAKGVKRLKSSSFAYPKTRKYPINTKKRARAALAYAARSDTAGSYSHVAAKVRKKYPGITIGGKKRKKR